MHINLWSEENELNFFKDCESFASKDQLFYQNSDGEYFAYWPKKYNGRKYTLQSRNSLIGNYTEKWVADLLNEIIRKKGLYAIQGVTCDSIGLNNRSAADVVISTKNKKNLKPEDIKVIFEVKMSLVWNWKYNVEEDTVVKVGDYKSHQGTPGLLRSDSILKAIGKCINIRVSDYQAAKIPLIVIGNTPISKNYYSKVDHLKEAGIIQGFWSINPKPLTDEDSIKHTSQYGFMRFDNKTELEDTLNKLLSQDLNFFSGMTSASHLGKIIEIANKEKTHEQKGLRFLNLLKENSDD